MWLKVLLLVLCLPTCALAASSQPISAKHGMVVSENELASNVGLDILKSGGNAIDAAVAVGYTLAVVNPCCGNIGGGGFMTIHLANGKNIVLNFREKAPLKASASIFLDEKGNLDPQKSLQGYLAVGVPGTVLGLDTALLKYGTMNRQQVMQPAIHFAEDGYLLTPYSVKLLDSSFASFKSQPNVAAIFLNHNKPYHVGERLVQKELANTLKKIAMDGSVVFYQGSIAKDIVSASEQNGGILSLKDFEQYRVQELSPIKCDYQGYTIISAPPPSSGGVTLCEMMNIIEKLPLENGKHPSANDIHYSVEAMRYAFSDRNNQLGDPDFIKNPVEKLISKKYAQSIQQKILTHQFPNTPSVKVTHENLNTTHYSIVDKDGNAVSVTYTLNGFFGAKVIAGNTGFFLNNEMDDFTIQTGRLNQFGLLQSEANSIQPGKRPLSSMTPTIILKGNNIFMVLGSPGGPRIITATLETLLNVMQYKMNIQNAVNAPRFHHQWVPDTLDYEQNTFPNELIHTLKNMGYHLSPKNTWGAVEAIQVDPKNHIIYGANDYRRPDGKAIGY